MTGLWNRKYGLEQLELAVANCAQVALLLIDVDHFGDYNEFFGYLPADEKLVGIAKEIESRCGLNALIFRLRADVFGVILYESLLENARKLAETIRANRREIQLALWDKTEYRMLTLSIGIAHLPTQVSSAENLLRAADLALMKAKGEGSSRLSDGTPYTGRNRVMAIGDFWDDFPEQSAQFLK